MDETAAQDGGRAATPGTASGRDEEAPTADRSAADDFFDAAIALLQQVRDGEGDAVREAGALLADTVAAGGRVFAFGAGHSSLPAQDTVYRAGGLAVMNLLNIPGAVGVDVRPATLGSALERVPGLAAAALDSSPARAGDLLIVISLSGRNALPVELAMNARALGLKVIGITSLAYSHKTRSRHTTGTFLKDHCDLVVDSRIALGDAELTAEGVGAPFAPASTVVTSALMQAVVAEATCALARKGFEPPMLRSGNVDGGHDWNARVMDAYADRIFYR
ncbi:SIS domain-containing protein [Streptomyces albus]|uniref:SIS domain-containing protein n=1 Tax=Streptomyces albus TaxID=1888 RepID=UPI0036FAB51D